MWCIVQGISMLCVVSVVTTMVIGINIEMHDIKKMITSLAEHHANGNPLKT
jgi:hypothetical protein